jgi:FlaA1/EpsC-like NDP-sugar epimerase
VKTLAKVEFSIADNPTVRARPSGAESYSPHMASVSRTLRVMVTGGTRGIGRAIVDELADSCTELTVLARSGELPPEQWTRVTLRVTAW